MIAAWREGAVGRIELRRPGRANAYTRAMLDALETAVAEFADLNVVVLSSEGRNFCGGADLGELGEARDAGAWEQALGLRSQAVFTALARAPFVSIAVVQGAAVAGGFELALACDLRVAGPGAVFSLPEPGLGIVPAAGGLTRLALLCGGSVARAVVLGGEAIGAERAVTLGLAHRLGGIAEGLEWAEVLAARPSAGVRRAKERLGAVESDVGLLLERSAQAGLYRR